MNDKYKKQISGLDIEGLKKELEDKEAELRKVILQSKKFGYAKTSNSTFHGNVSRTRHQIAILLTKIKEKEK